MKNNVKENVETQNVARTLPEPVYIYPEIAKQLEFQDGRCTNAFEVIAKYETLLMAYESIKSNPGNMTKGVDDETLDGITED